MRTLHTAGQCKSYVTPNFLLRIWWRSRQRGARLSGSGSPRSGWRPYLFATSQCRQINTVAAPSEHQGAQHETAVHEPFTMHAIGLHSRHAVNRLCLAPCQSSDKDLNTVLAILLDGDGDGDGVNAHFEEKLPQKIASWTGANDGYLSTHLSRRYFLKS